MFGSENLTGADNQQERLNTAIQPWYISGFVDGEGSFHVAFARRPDLPRKWSIIPEFHVSQNPNRAAVLTEIKEYFDCGTIKQNHSRHKSDHSLVYVVRKREDLLQKIIPFFETYALRSSKQQDFLLFAEIVRFMNDGKHRSLAGFRTIVHKAYQMNGLGNYRKISKVELLG